MDVTQISQLISTTGFPIFACIAMAYYINSTTKKLTLVIEDNTKIIAQLVERLRMRDDNGTDL